MYRSRLSRLEERRSIQKARWLVLATIAALVAIGVFGLPVLVKLAGFLGDLRSSGQPIEKNDTIPPTPPRWLTSYDATNSAQIALSGLAEAGATVFVTQNQKDIGSVVVSDTGEFQLNNITLDKGGNVFAAVAVDQAGNKSRPSTVVEIVFSSSSPQLEIDSPKDLETITGTSVEVKGRTDASRLTINDRYVIVSPEGLFSATFKLHDGENVLVLVASDPAGNQTRKELTVTAKP